MAERPQTPSTLEEPTEKLEGPVPEMAAPSSEEHVTYEEVMAPSPGISIPEIPEIGPEVIGAKIPEEGVGPELEAAIGEERTAVPHEVMEPIKVVGIPDIPEEESWSEVVYEEGGPPPGFQA
ncbi:MAG: hypothetical protein JRE64_05715 [Deltaproteobacteria bacterium]|nr:hypothetical protein [Deltaproteobacteria bacterium]